MLHIALVQNTTNKSFASFQAGKHSSHISWVEGDAQNLQFDDNTFDAYTIAFGIRNVVDIDQVKLGVAIKTISEFGALYKTSYIKNMFKLHKNVYSVGDS